MKKIFIFLLTLFFSMGSVSAADYLNVADISVPQGGQATMTIGFQFDNADVYAAYQLNLILPKGISPVTDADNEIVVSTASSHDASHMIQSRFDNETNSWIITCLSAKAKTFKGVKGDLFSLTLKADADITVGEVLEGKISGIVLSDAANKAYKLSDVSFYITVAQPIDSRVVLNEESTTALTSATDADVRVIRTIKGGEWNTIVLPFSMTESQLKDAFGNDVRLADFIGYDVETEGDEVVAIDVQFTFVSSLEANHPYIIKTKNDVPEFTVNGVEINPEEPIYKKGTSNRKFKNFVGTYVADTTVPEEALFINDGQFWYSRGKTKMKAFRAYFEFYQVIESGNSSRIAMVFDNAEATGIASNISTTPADNHYYNLQGQRISHPAKGIFIKGNKKVVNN